MTAALDSADTEPLAAPAPAAIGYADTGVLRRRRPAYRLTRPASKRVAMIGRAGAIWLTVYAVLLGENTSLGSKLVLAALLSAIWFVTLSKAFSAGAMSLALGEGCAAGVGTAGGLVAASMIALWLPRSAASSELSLLSLMSMAAGVFAISWAWQRLVQRTLAGQRRVMIVSDADAGTDLAERLSTGEKTCFELVELIDADDAERIGEVLDSAQPDIVVLAMRDLQGPAFERLLDAAGNGFRVVGLAEFYEHAFGRVPLETVRPEWFMSVLHLYQRPYSRFAKRAFDLTVAVVGLALTSWLFPFIALAVRGTPGSVLFRQTRLGERGRTFEMFKFRTMYANAEDAGAAWASPDDPRVTPVGRVLRRTRLDELPQLINVLRGEMSVVGPRPERPEFLRALQDAVPFWVRRHLVKPGITGWAQVHCGYASDTDATARKLSHDLWYLRHRCLVVDVAVCAKTLVTMARRSGR